MALAKFSWDAASPSACMEANGNGGAVSVLDDALDGEAKRFPRSEHGVPKVAQTIVPAICRLEVWEGPCRQKLDLRIELLEPPLEVSLAPNGVRGTNEALVRHGPRSIPQAQESA